MKLSACAITHSSPPYVRGYRRREPENTTLYQVLAKHLETFLHWMKQNDSREGLPGFVERELRGFLDCGILAKSFVRVHCPSCGKDSLVAFSCKKRGICPSCGGRRMADTAARQVDCILPCVPIRQWVLSLPYPVRFAVAYNPDLCREVRNIFLRSVFQYFKKRAKRYGLSNPQCAAVTFVQRFGGSLNLNVHFHALILDGVYVPSESQSKPRFQALRAPSEEDISQLLTKVRFRIQRKIRKRGLAEELSEEPGLLESYYAASVQGKIALGPKKGARITRLGEKELQAFLAPNQKLCAHFDGFSLHAGLRIAARDRDRLERLCRYVARPAISNERLSELPDGRLLYELKTPYTNGTTHLLFDPLTFLEKLAALIPPPRVNLVLYHGVLAPNSKWRSQIVPQPPTAQRTENPSSPPRQNLLWAELIRRVFEVDVLICPWCAGPRKVLALIQNPQAIQDVLEHLGLPTQAPPVDPPRPPPDLTEETDSTEPL